MKERKDFAIGRPGSLVCLFVTENCQRDLMLVLRNQLCWYGCLDHVESTVSGPASFLLLIIFIIDISISNGKNISMSKHKVFNTKSSQNCLHNKINKWFLVSRTYNLFLKLHKKHQHMVVRTDYMLR